MRYYFLIHLALMAGIGASQTRVSLAPEEKGGAASRFATNGSTEQKRRLQKARDMKRRAEGQNRMSKQTT